MSWTTALPMMMSSVPSVIPGFSFSHVEIVKSRSGSMAIIWTGAAQHDACSVAM